MGRVERNKKMGAVWQRNSSANREQYEDML